MMANDSTYSTNEFSFRHPMTSQIDKHNSTEVRISYMVTMGVILFLFTHFKECGFSTCLTLAGIIQVFACVALFISVSTRQSMKGLSTKMVILQSMVYTFRLSSTLWLRGYLPTDGTGAWLYQLCDIVALMSTVGVLHLSKQLSGPKTNDHDSMFPLKPTIAVCVIIAILIHPDLNDFPLFDTFWTIALYLDVVSLLPQLMLIVRTSEDVHELSIHFIAAMTLSKAINTIFWWYAFEELTPEFGPNIPGFTILGAHIIQLVIMADFIYHYVKALIFKTQFYYPEGMFC